MSDRNSYWCDEDLDNLCLHGCHLSGCTFVCKLKLRQKFQPQRENNIEKGKEQVSREVRDEIKAGKDS